MPIFSIRLVDNRDWYLSHKCSIVDYANRAVFLSRQSALRYLADNAWVFSNLKCEIVQQ